MKSHARVVIVGGGVMGVGLLYHLPKEGWNDVVLVEKGELTSGSTWHAAALVPNFIGSLNMAKVHVAASHCNTAVLHRRQVQYFFFRNLRPVLEDFSIHPQSGNTAIRVDIQTQVRPCLMRVHIQHVV